jgi:GT2 family glycosyltransferase
MGTHGAVASDGCLILATVVLYKRSIEHSEAVQALLHLLVEDSALAASFRVLLYDNSPASQNLPEAPGIALSYCHDAQNAGLAVAYNHALGLAVEDGIPWLMLLDQDTRVTADYLHELIALQPVAGQDPKIAAFAPKLAGATGLRSPSIDFIDSLRRQVTLPHRRRPMIVPPETYGPQHCRLVAFNSGAVIRTQAMLAMGGFPAAYWLDFLDMAVFHDLYGNGNYLFVMKTTLEHSLSVEADDFLQLSHSLARHRNILSAMIYYVKTNGSPWERLLHRAWLLRNALSLLVRHGGRPFALESLRQFFLYSATPRAGTPGLAPPASAPTARHNQS